MEKGTRVAVKSLITQDGITIKIKYEITERDAEGNTSYGIAISSYDYDDILNEFVEIRDITQNIVEIETLLMVLYTYEVTPVTLYDVLDVYLADPETIKNALN